MGNKIISDGQEDPEESKKYILNILEWKLPLAAAKHSKYDSEIEYWADWLLRGHRTQPTVPPQSNVRIPPQQHKQIASHWPFRLCSKSFSDETNGWPSRMMYSSLRFRIHSPFLWKPLSLSPAPSSLSEMISCPLYETLGGLSLKMSCLPLVKPGLFESHSKNFRSWM